MKARSVPALRVTSYCSGVSCSRHSCSVFSTFVAILLLSLCDEGTPGYYEPVARSMPPAQVHPYRMPACRRLLRARRRRLRRHRADPGALGPRRPARRAAVGAARPRDRAARGGEGFQVGRVTFEILRPVPIGPVRVEARVAPARAAGADGRGVAERRRGEELMRARAWRICAGRELDLPAEAVAARTPPPPGPEQGSDARVLPDRAGRRLPHGDGVAGRSRGGFLEPGPATVWMRMRQPLVAGEEPTPLQRTLIAADVGNGISAVARLPPRSSSSTSTSPSTSSGCRRASGSASTPSPCRSRAGSAPPSRSSSTSAAGSAAPLQTLLIAER